MSVQLTSFIFVRVPRHILSGINSDQEERAARLICARDPGREVIQVPRYGNENKAH